VPGEGPSEISNYLIPPPSDTRQRPPVYILVRPARRSEVRDYRLLPTLYTYLSLSTVYRKFIDANTDLYGTPTLNLPSNLKPLLLLHPPLIPPTSFQTPYRNPPPSYKLLRTYQSLLQTYQSPLRTTIRPYGKPLPFYKPLRTY